MPEIYIPARDEIEVLKVGNRKIILTPFACFAVPPQGLWDKPPSQSLIEGPMIPAPAPSYQ